jgi:peroxiredoxin
MRVLVLEKGQSWSGNERNCSFLNTGNGRFVNTSSITGAEFIDDARSMAPVDWDNDGDLDMVLKNRTAPRMRMLRNDYDSKGHYLALDLVATQGHPDAIGASVKIEAGGKTFMRRVYCGDGFLSQRSRRLHFSFGEIDAIDKLTVHWTHGPSESFDGVSMDRTMRITQGASEATQLTVAEGEVFRAAEHASQERAGKGVVRVPLIAKLPMSPFPIPAFNMSDRIVRDMAGKPLLINLWATWCGGCKVELKEFHERADDLKRAGVQIVPLTPEDPSMHEAGKKMLAKFGLEHVAGHADEKLMAAIRVLITEVVGESKDAPMPTSLLVDPDGRLSVIYLGPVSVDVLLRDVKRMKRAGRDSYLTTEQFGGGRWTTTRERHYRLMARGFRLLGFGELANYYQQIAKERKGK